MLQLTRPDTWLATSRSRGHTPMSGYFFALFSCSLGIGNCSCFHFFCSRIDTVFTPTLSCGHVASGFAYLKFRRSICCAWSRPSLPLWDDFCNDAPMGLLPDTYNCGLRMRRERRERFPRHQIQRMPLVSDPGMHHGTCVTHVPCCMSGSPIRGGGETVPGIPGACATHNFTYLARGPCFQVRLWYLWWFYHTTVFLNGHQGEHHRSCAYSHTLSLSPSSSSSSSAFSDCPTWMQCQVVWVGFPGIHS